MAAGSLGSSAESLLTREGRGLPHTYSMGRNPRDERLVGLGSRGHSVLCWAVLGRTIKLEQDESRSTKEERNLFWDDK